MALQKDLDTAYGVMANYHKVVCVLHDRVRQRVEVQVAVYKDILNKHKSPLERKVYEFGAFEGADGPYCLDLNIENPENVNHVSLCYAALKQLSDYEGAIDV